MTKELKRHDNKAKAKEPDTFNGSDPHKLISFLLLCNLYFHNNFSYAEDNTKVTFVLTYLWGTALNFFELADAEDSIDNLKMRNNQHILKYNIDSNRLAIQTGWSDNVL